MLGMRRHSAAPPLEEGPHPVCIMKHRKDEVIFVPILS